LASNAAVISSISSGLRQIPWPTGTVVTYPPRRPGHHKGQLKESIGNVDVITTKKCSHVENQTFFLEKLQFCTIVYVTL
jgi:hypothetical protein